MLQPLAFTSKPGLDVAAYSGQRLINYFPRPGGELTSVVLMSRGGLEEFARMAQRPIRAMTSLQGALYAIANGKVARISQGSFDVLGEVPDGATSVAATQSEIAITVAGEYFICDGNSVTKYETGALEAVTSVEAMDGYFILIGSSGGREDAFTISGLDDGTTFNALEFAFAEKNPDALVDIVRDHDVLWLLGERTVQMFVNTGNADFPFGPIAGGLIEHGCVSGTAAKADNTVFWVRPDGSVLRSSGSSPAVISTPEIKDELEGAELTGGFTFSERGHEFYAVHRAGGTTLVFCLVTQQWHERSTGLAYGPWKACGAYELGGVTYFACTDGRVATSSAEVFEDFGEVMSGEAVSAPVQFGGNRVRVSKVHANLLGGKRNIGRTPQVVMQTSEDGLTWRREHWRNLQKQGVHQRRAVWHGLGLFWRFQARIRVTDPVERDIIGVEVSFV